MQQQKETTKIGDLVFVQPGQYMLEHMLDCLPKQVPAFFTLQQKCVALIVGKRLEHMLVQLGDDTQQCVYVHEHLLHLASTGENDGK